MSNAPESKWLTPNGGLPTGNGWDKSQLVEYTRTDIHDTAMARIAELEAALRDVCQAIAWQEFGECRGWSESLKPLSLTLLQARTALKAKP